VIATRSQPSLGTGLLEEQSETTRIRDLSRQIFQSGLKNTRFVTADQNVASALNELLPPDFATNPAVAPFIGFVHRKLDSGDVYFVTNASNRPVSATASVRVSGPRPQWWNPFDGEATAAEYQLTNGRGNLAVSLAPYESKILVFGGNEQAAEPVLLDFGSSVPVEPAVQDTPGMHALLDSPVREAAVIVVNGKRAGAVWHPPYELDIKFIFRPGRTGCRLR
jgi:alpha-L-rhamnosidase